MQSINVSLAQLIPKLGDKRYNLNLMRESMMQAKESKSDIIVFPELFLTGYSVEDDASRLAEPAGGPSINKIKKMCKKHSIYVVFGFVERSDGNKYYISSALIDSKGELLGIYRKTHLFDKEKKYFTPGSEFKVISTPIGKIGLMICFDVEFPEIARVLKLMGADFLIIVNANMVPYEQHHYIYAKARAMENEIPVVICNRLGKENDLKFCGDSMVVDAMGNELLNFDKFEGVKTVELPLALTTDPKLTYVSNRRGELYSTIANGDN